MIPRKQVPHASIALVIGLFLLPPGCTTPPVKEGASDGAGEAGEGHLRSGPTVKLEETIVADTSVLEMLDRKTEELKKSEERNESLARRIDDLQVAVKRYEASDADLKAEIQRTKAMLKDALAAQTKLTDELLAVKIAKLRLEQENVRLKMGALAKEEKD